MKFIALITAVFIQQACFSQADTAISIYVVPDSSKGAFFCDYLPTHKSAQFPGGPDSLKGFIRNNLKWPDPGFCGEVTIFVCLTIDPTGKFEDINIKKSSCQKCNAEALRIVSLMPKWIPAEDENGKSILSNAIFPIRFRIKR